MDNDFNALFGELLQNPETMEKLGTVFSALSSAPSPATAHAGEENMLSRLLPLLQGGGDDNREVALLRALRPYLHGGREKRVDEAIEMLRLVKLLPLLTDRRKE